MTVFQGWLNEFGIEDDANFEQHVPAAFSRGQT